jgi:hypothetical protein
MPPTPQPDLRLGRMLSAGLLILQFGQNFFDAAVEFTSGKEHAPPACVTGEPNIRAEAHHGPFISAAGVLFSQPDTIIEVQVGQHSAHYITIPSQGSPIELEDGWVSMGSK